MTLNNAHDPSAEYIPIPIIHYEIALLGSQKLNYSVHPHVARQKQYQEKLPPIPPKGASSPNKIGFHSRKNATRSSTKLH